MTPARELPPTVALKHHDEEDAIRVVTAAVTIAAIPGIISQEAREMASRRLRELAHGHPSNSEIFAAIIEHLEKY